MINNVKTQECCYLSTPNHIKSFVGRFIYIYTSKGSLSLSSDSLIFSSKNSVLNIPIESILEISIHHYSRISKPFRLDYISVKYQLNGQEDTILLTPTKSFATPVWKTNIIVAEWADVLADVIGQQKVA